ncbi:MAG TPA: glucose 1-dehydrogenase [Candidatus Methylomirabilis sp.]|jgi:2-deoxy-D-gluconate 3-dehydrogenase
MILDTFRLDGRVAWVTGASRGLGKAMAVALAEAGADLVLSARTVVDLEGTASDVKRLGRRAVVVQADVTRRADAEAVVAKAIAAFDRIDILVNNAGVSAVKSLLETEEADWDHVLATNVRGPYLCTRAAGPHMIARKAGKVINIASVLSFIGEPYVIPYAASKGAILQFTRGLAIEWARYNIQVNAICPGYFSTAMNVSFLESEEGQAYIKQWVPMRRAGRPEELGPVVVFLASSASDFMTGAHILIDGGQAAR